MNSEMKKLMGRMCVQSGMNDMMYVWKCTEWTASESGSVLNQSPGEEKMDARKEKN